MKKNIDLAIQIRSLYKKIETNKFGRSWSATDLAQGFVSDVGDLQKIVMAKAGMREMENVDEKLAHELADCLWSVIVLADEYNIDLEQVFVQQMTKLKEKLEQKLAE